MNINSTNLSSFGEWELQRCLGTGGFGEVLLWKNKRTNLEIATKRLKENNRLSADEVHKLMQRWTQEYKWMRDLNTAFIVKGIDIQDDAFLDYLNVQHAWAPLPVIVMEYCNGGDLRAQLQKIENINGLCELEVRQVMHALRHAVEYLHTVCRIEHRDIKPDNIVIQQQGDQRCYKLTDFGFARNCSENTILKSVVGTRHYFAPEVVDTALYTNTVDYWSLGVIAHELMCGQLPFIPHQELFQIIVNIKKKPAQCIAIEEDLVERNRFHFQTQICAEHNMSSVFVSKMQEWLRLALDTNYKTRGTLPTKSTELCFYTMLDDILQTRILKVFCLNTFKFYDYELRSDMSFLALLEAMETDTKLMRKNFYFVYPTGHPRATLSAQTVPMDIFVEEWQNAHSTTGNPPVMLYLVGYKCNFIADDPRISKLIKRCLSLNANNLPADWQLQQLLQQTHYLLSNEQRHLEALLQGLKEYAMTVENEIFNFDASIQTLLEAILQLNGSVQQFQSMISLAEKAYEARGKPLNNSVRICFDIWQGKSKELNAEMQKIDLNLAQSVKKRYKSALRRSKEQANSKLYEQLMQSDIYGLKDFREYIESTRRRFEAQMHLAVCQKAVYNCLEQRNMFLSNKQLQQCRCTISDVHEEFRKICDIVNDSLKYCKRFKEQISSATYDFQSQLLDVNAAIVNGAKPQLLLKMPEPINMHINGLCASLENIMQLPTNTLIQEALQSVELMTVDCADSPTEIPKTINFI